MPQWIVNKAHKILNGFQRLVLKKNHNHKVGHAWLCMCEP